MTLRKAKTALIFDTANGKAKATHVCPMKITIMMQTIAPYVLDNTPCLLSVGVRVMGLGWHQI